MKQWINKMTTTQHRRFKCKILTIGTNNQSELKIYLRVLRSKWHHRMLSSWYTIYICVLGNCQPTKCDSRSLYTKRGTLTQTHTPVNELPILYNLKKSHNGSSTFNWRFWTIHWMTLTHTCSAAHAHIHTHFVVTRLNEWFMQGAQK